MKKYIILLFSLYSFYAIGQMVTPDSELDYIIEEFTLPGGRQGNNVNSIVQGPYGFVWFGSHGGLHRYDGYEFITYKSIPGDTVGETTSLTFPYIENLYWDKSDKLWVCTLGGGLYRFDPKMETFKHFPHNPNDSTSISHHNVISAVEDVNGQLWFGTDNGLNRYDSNSGTFKRYFSKPDDPQSISSGRIATLYVDKQGTLWAGTGFVYFGGNEGSLSRYNPETDSFTNYTYDPNNDNTIWTSAVRGILEDSQGNFWVGTNKGLQKMNRSKGTFQRMIYDPDQPYAPGAKDRATPAVYSIHEDKKGGLWVGTIGDPTYPTHLLRYDPDTKKSQVFPSQGSAWQLCESSDGTIWIAGAGIGGKVLKIRPKPKSYHLFSGNFMTDSYKASELSRQLKMDAVFGPINMAIEQSSGNFWLQLVVADSVHNPSHFGAVLAKFNPTSKSFSYHHLSDLKPAFDFNMPSIRLGINGLIIDSVGTLWGSLPDQNIGIFNYDPITNKTLHYQNDPTDSLSLSSNNIITIIMDSRGDIWAATYENGLNRLNPTTGKVTRFHFNDQPGAADAPISLMEDGQGMVWVGGELVNGPYSCLVAINPNDNSIKKYNMPDIGTLLVVTTMAQSPITGQIVFSINDNGIGIFDPEKEKFSFRNSSNGFPFDDVAGVVCDREGIFWMAETMTPAFVKTNLDDDFLFEEPMEWGSQWRNGILGSNGHVYFLHMSDGWFEIDPSKVKPENDLYTSNVQLVDIYLSGEKQTPKPNSILTKAIWLMDKIILPFNTENFAFRFSDFDFQIPNAQFQFRLYPYETFWRNSGTTPMANYYRVPSGEYSFQVKPINRNSSNDTQLVELQVIILPPWWKTIWAYSIYILLFIGAVYAVDRYQRKRLLNKSISLAREKELEHAKQIEKAYKELKSTQAQLIHSEKMASLGELTAGIAHEIQNPLNFVNNFSELNQELICELDEALAKGNTKEAKEVVKDLKENEQKIYNHGKRADAIVKGMLEHSRTSSGEKVLTDINALADEYLRLSYHGMRAKDRSFNAAFETHLDPLLPKVKVVPQDIGRVLLNVINNAFQAVGTTKSLQPMVTVSTKSLGDKIEISISDNGPGIPDDIKDKIFQPFFTTKPTGQGTGLGLSLSYDIVKAHGGELKVVSEVGRGSEFIINLPNKLNAHSSQLPGIH